MMEKIIAIINTLNKIEVHGTENLDRLLGCILALQSILEDDQNGNTDQ